MRLDPITVSTRLQIAWRDLCLHFFILLLSGGHSSLDPRLPIPNRTAKRVCADDSVHSARESRLPPGHLHKKPRARESAGVFCWWRSSWSLPVTLAPLAKLTAVRMTIQRQARCTGSKAGAPPRAVSLYGEGGISSARIEHGSGSCVVSPLDCSSMRTPRRLPAPAWA